MKKQNRTEKASVQKALLDKKKSAISKYIDIFIGKKGIWQIIKYECILLFFSRVPGALGLFLRKIFYSMIFKKVGRGVVFGHHMTIRHPHKISIGDNTFIDDYVVLDAKGEENKGIVIGQNAFIGRNTILSCKEGSIYLRDFANISANCSLLSETVIDIGKYSFLAGHCYLVAGGNHSFQRKDIPIMLQPSLQKGGITIEEDCWLGASVTVLDGVCLGKGCVIGAGAVVTKSFPGYSIAVGCPARKLKDRGI
ncbi:MAG: acyltransferase [Acidobacteriota bacterium]|nr:acyltransferase [Acidobacteriota bacterium]